MLTEMEMLHSPHFLKEVDIYPLADFLWAPAFTAYKYF